MRAFSTIPCSDLFGVLAEVGLSDACGLSLLFLAVLGFLTAVASSAAEHRF